MYVVPEDVRISDVVGPRAARRLYKRALASPGSTRRTPGPDIVLDRTSGKIVLCTNQERPRKFQSLLVDRDVVERFRAMPMTLWTRTQPARSFGKYIKRLQRPPRDDDNDDDDDQDPMKFVPVISMVPWNSVLKGQTKKR